MKIGPATTQAALAKCHAIRRAVFIEEQHVSEAEEWDSLDPVCTHFLAWDETGPIATARLYPDGETAKIGRVAVMSSHRGEGHGLALMRTVLRHARDKGFRRAAIDAQTYAIPFYERFGFVAEGPEFDDAGMVHRHMRLEFQSARTNA